MAHVISYTRFSTKRQERGHSKGRQDDQAYRWCLDNGHELDLESSMHDPGYSAYRGDNLSRGALGVLQEACIAGKLEKNTILLIEAFDRFTRLPLPLAYEALLSLINRGVTIVTLTDCKVWNSKTLQSLEAFMLSLITLYRGFEESERKSVRLQATFEDARKKRRQAAFGSAPGWLTRETKEAPWTVDEAKASSVVRCFEMSAAGYGSKAIAKRANEEGWPVPTRLQLTGDRWHSRMPGRLLRSRAVLGHHEHMLHTHEAHQENPKGVPTGIHHHDYYPRIISDELFAAARASIESRSMEKRRDTHYYNIFSGLMYCGQCGAPIHRRTETRGYSKATLSCADKTSGASAGCPPCAAVTVDAPVLEAIFNNQPAAAVSEDHSIELENLAADIKEKQAEIQRITDTIAKVGPLDPLTDKLQQLAMEHDIHSLARESLLVALANDLMAPSRTGVVVADAIGKLYVPDLAARDFRAALRLRLGRLVETIWLWGYEVAIVKFKHSDKVEVVELDPKRLPSRANTLAKWHKPLKPKTLPPRPHLESARAGTLPLPAPRRA